MIQLLSVFIINKYIYVYTHTKLVIEISDEKNSVTNFGYFVIELVTEPISH